MYGAGRWILWKKKKKPHDRTEPCGSTMRLGKAGWLLVKPCYALLCLFLGKMLGVFLLELFNTTSSINQFLFTSEKRMAGRTDLNVYAFIHRAQFNFITTGTFCLDFMIFRMDIRFHWILSLQRIYSPHSELLFTVC